MSNFASMETAKTLKGEVLYDYMTLFYNDDDYRKIVELLPIALAGDMHKVYDVLERSIRENKRLTLVYPSQDDAPQDNWELIGSIIDGALYLQPLN